MTNKVRQAPANPCQTLYTSRSLNPTRLSWSPHLSNASHLVWPQLPHPLKSTNSHHHKRLHLRVMQTSNPRSDSNYFLSVVLVSCLYLCLCYSCQNPRDCNISFQTCKFYQSSGANTRTCVIYCFPLFRLQEA
jgi:hypothetical protein